MNVSKKLLAVLAVFCVIASAGMVCAADVGSDGNWTVSQGPADDVVGIDAGANQDLNMAHDESSQNLEPGNGLPLENQTGYVPVNAAGEPINQTGNSTAPVAGNATGNATSNGTANSTGNAPAVNAVSHSMPVTGNPILALLAVSAVLGGYAAIRRK